MTPTVDKTIEWDIGTAYDFFISLRALHEPSLLGLRGAWAAGVRSRMPSPERETLQRMTLLAAPMPWVYKLPTPKDVATILRVMRDLPHDERLLVLSPRSSEKTISIYHDVARRGAWRESDQKILIAEMIKERWKDRSTTTIRKDAASFLDLWSKLDESAEKMLAAYESYNEVFFIEEEARIRPALEAGLARAKELNEKHEHWEALLEEISQGVRVAKDWENKKLILAPSYWGTPLAIMAEFDPDNLLFLFGVRPEDESLIPGDVVPDALYQGLKALADPTRLRILRYMNEGVQTPAELARKLRLRSPTVIHHLDALRLARLVTVTLVPEGKRYAIRPDAIASTSEILQQFLFGKEEQ